MLNHQMQADKEKSVCIPVFSNRLAGVLMAQNFVLIDFKPNLRQPNRNVFFFVDSVPLQKAIAEYKARG